MDTATATRLVYRRARAPFEDESYRDYLNAHGVLGHGFGFRELVRGTRRLDAPPRRYWPNMPPTMVLVNVLRDRMIERHNARGLRIQAAYRRTGGSKYSRHKTNHAIDADLLREDRHLAGAYYEEATILWCEVGEDYEAGLGLYCPAGRRSGIRTHWDTGTRDRTWQLTGRAYVKPAASIKIAHHLGLEPPTENDQ